MEKVENNSLPVIEILCAEAGSQDLAEAVGYGIEEEGLPYHITCGAFTSSDVYELCHGVGLGVSILIREGTVSVFTRQLQEKRPLFAYPVRSVEMAKAIGKNAARIIKNKPFIDLDEMEEHDVSVKK